MNDESALRQALKELADSLPDQAGPATEERLLRTFCQHRHRTRVKWWFAAAAILALALSGVFFARHAHRAEPPQTVVNTFVPLPYGQSDVPLEHGVIVRVQVPSGAGPVNADVLVGQDGMARAIRYTE